jgi:hypothetical protein
LASRTAGKPSCKRRGHSGSNDTGGVVPGGDAFAGGVHKGLLKLRLRGTRQQDQEAEEETESTGY